MRVDVVLLPSQLQEHHLRNRAVVVLDVLRATTTMAAAMAAGALEIRAFDSLEAAQTLAAAFNGPKLLCGERNCLPPAGFDLGNSPTDFTRERSAGKTIFMSTTNGTRAIVAAARAGRRLAAALVNRTATARALWEIGCDVTLLCAGTDGTVAPEDMIGAGSIVESLMQSGEIHANSSTTTQSLQLFQDNAANLLAALKATRGGQNVIAANLERDVHYAARLDVIDLALEVSGNPPAVKRMIGSCP